MLNKNSTVMLEVIQQIHAFENQNQIIAFKLTADNRLSQ